METTRDALWNWIRAVAPLKDRVQDTTHLTHVIYGHTHVRDSFQFRGTTILSWNLGSWLVEPGEPPPQPGFLAIDTSGTVRWFDVR